MSKGTKQRWVRVTLTLLLLLVVASGTGVQQWASNSVATLSQAGESVENEGPDRYAPVGSVAKGGEAEALAQLEMDWNNRLTYPTGRFDPAWIRQAAAQDSRISRVTPAGSAVNSGSGSKSPSGKGGPLDGAATLTMDPDGFTSLGPQPLHMTGCSGCYNYTTTAGRVNTIAIDPVVTSTAYIGTVGGGVWKTTNCCSSATTWIVVTDDPVLSTISIDDITIDPGNHNTVYAGTGDLNYGSFSMGSQGILKSTDSGATWVVVGQDVFGAALPEPAGQFPQYQAVGKVRVDPRNSNNVVAGTKTGLYFSYDAGENWTGPCITNNFSTQRQDITGLSLNDTGTGTRIIASVGVRGFASPVQYNLDQNGANGLYRGTVPGAGCPTDFSLISTNANGWTNTNAGSGARYINSTTGNQLGRIDIAVAPSNPNYIYAQVQAITASGANGCGGAQGCQLGVWRTTNGGATWSQLAGSLGSQLRNCTNGGGDYSQNWYDQGLAVDPNNPDRVFIDTFDVWFWANGSTSFNDVTCGYSYSGSSGPVHVDQHALTFVPGSSSILLAGNDGGVHMTANAQVASSSVDPTWTNIDNGLNTIEFYSGDISGFFATSSVQMANGGAQDNGSSTVKYTNGAPGPAQWQMGTGGDGFYARIDPVAGRFWQGGNSGGVTRCIAADCTLPGTSWSTARGAWTGDTQAFQLPYEIFKGTPDDVNNDCSPAPAGCNHLIAGTTRVWETINGDAASGNPVRNSWYVNSPDNLTKQTLGNRSYINQLAYSPILSTTAVVGTNDGNVQYGFGLGQGLARSATWVNVTGGNTVLPNRPILDVTIDPTTPTTAYAAVGGFNANTPDTQGHIFQVTCTANCASFAWANKTGNLPDIPVDSIIANPRFPQQVFAGTDFGLYFTNDVTADSPAWYRFQNGLPNVMIWDMQIDRGFTTLSVWTRGRGAYIWPLPNAPVHGSQTITFNPMPGKTYGDPDFAINASASSGLPVTLEATGNCTVSEGVAHITGAGSCSITASQAGDENFSPAPSVTRTFNIARALLSVTADNKATQYTDPVALTASYTGFVYNETESSLRALGALSGEPTLQTSATTSSPAGNYPITIGQGTLAADNYTFQLSNGTLTVSREDAAIQYTGETIAPVNTNLNLRVTAWDSAASGYQGANAESGGNATIGDITRMWIRFDIYSANSCGSGTPTATRYAQITDSGVSGDGIGTAGVTYTSSSEASYCVVASVVGNSSGDTNNYYTTDAAEGGVITFYVNSGQAANGGGWIFDPAGGKGNFGLNARYNKNGSAQGQLVYVYRGLYNGVQADFIIKSNSLGALLFTGDNYPYTATLQGRATIQVNRASDGVQLYSSGNNSFTVVVKDGGPGTDSFALTVYDRDGVPYKSVPVDTPLQGGNIIVRSR